jgi:hypothetical protein
MRRRRHVARAENVLRGLTGQPQLVPAKQTVVTAGIAHERSLGLPGVVQQAIVEDKPGAVVAFGGGLIGRELPGWVAGGLGLNGLDNFASEAIGSVAVGWGARRLYRWLRRSLRR